MRSMHLRTFMRVVPALAAVVSAAVAATAGIAATPSMFCSASPLSKPFVPWGDSSAYSLVPDGGFEAGGAGWALAGGASIAFGNESYRVHGASDTRMLSLPAGASATSPALCVDDSVPTLRFFVSGPYASTSQLKVDAFYVDSSGVAAWH